MRHTWGRQDQGGPHVDYMNFAIWVIMVTWHALALSGLWEGNPPVTGGFRSQRAINADLWCFLCLSHEHKQSSRRLLKTHYRLYDAERFHCCGGQPTHNRATSVFADLPTSYELGLLNGNIAIRSLRNTCMVHVVLFLLFFVCCGCVINLCAYSCDIFTNFFRLLHWGWDNSIIAIVPVR